MPVDWGVQFHLMAVVFMTLLDKPIIVTGGAGFIGSHLVDALLASDVPSVVAVDDFFLGDGENLRDAHASQRFVLERVDASDLAAMQSIAMSHPGSTLLSLATVPLPTSLSYPVFTTARNVRLGITSSELVRQGYVEALIQLSSSEVYGTAKHVPMDEDHPREPETPYAASKAAADDVLLSYCRTFGINAMILRPFNNFGSRQNASAYAGVIPRVVGRLTQGLPIEIHGDGTQTRDFVSVGDTVAAILAVLRNEVVPGVAMNVATGVETSVNSLVSMILDVCGRADHPRVHTEPRIGDVRRHCGDPSLLERLTGYRPKPISAEALRDCVSWFQTRSG